MNLSFTFFFSFYIVHLSLSNSLTYDSDPYRSVGYTTYSLFLKTMPIQRMVSMKNFFGKH